MARFVLMAILVAASTAACSAEETDPKPATDEGVAATTWRGPTVVHVDPVSRWAFEVPAPPFRVKSTNFDPATPPGKIKQRFELKDDARLMVRIDLWANPEGLALSSWIDTHASYLKNGGADLEETTVGKTRVNAIVADQPRSCQAANIITAVFALDGHVIAVTCANGEDPVARRTFDVVLNTFAREEAR
jgi:hypothetical protein